MINRELITYLHSVYPELPVDESYIKGYSPDEIAKMERLYDIKVTGQLYDFLLCMGRCSGGLFGDYPLMFYRDVKDVRSHFLSQYQLWDELCKFHEDSFAEENPFLIAIESYTQYDFLLTTSSNPNLVYSYDEDDETVKPTRFTFNEYLRRIVDKYSRRYIKNMAPDYHGEMINI